jgi:hypothetical protein
MSAQLKPINDVDYPVVKVKFRFRIDLPKSNRDMMRNYGTKFTRLLTTLSKVQLTKNDYSDLPKIREYVNDDLTVADLSRIFVEVVAGDLQRMILDIAPVFDNAPTDLKSYIILASGIRSKHFERLSHA